MSKFDDYLYDKRIKFENFQTIIQKEFKEMKVMWLFENTIINIRN